MRIRIPKSNSRAPVGIAAFLAIPLFFSSLMASALAQEKANKFQWKDPKCHPICTVWHPPSTSNEARIWLWAIVPSLVLVVVGLIAARLPLGFYVSCVSAIAIAMAVVHKTEVWAQHHTARFPYGIDLIPGFESQSNQWSAGQWEDEARSTALSLQHWTIGIALAAMLAMGLLWLRSRRKHPEFPVVATGAAIETTGGAPQITAP